jgi:type I restriction enzyme S subunit
MNSNTIEIPQTQKVPNSYKQTAIGLIPSDWEVKKLGEIGSFSKGKGILKAQVLESGLPCIRYGEIYTTHHFIVKEFKSYISEEVASESQEISKGDILFAGSGETIDDIGKAVVYIGNEKAYAGGDTIIFKPKDDSSETISYILEMDSSRKQKRTFGQGNSVVHIYPSELKKLKIAIPPLPEQQKIATILSTWDKAIDNCKAIIEELKVRNKGLTQKLLTGKMRVSGFNEKWKVKVMNECLNFTPRPITKPSENYLALGLRSHGKGVFHKTDFDPATIAMDTMYEVKENDLIINITFAWEHAVAIVSKNDEGGLVSHRFPTYTFNSQNATPDFFRHFVLQKYFKFLLELISPGGAGRNRVMSKTDFLKLEVKLPNVAEQNEIAIILDKATEELNQYQQKLQTLQLQKKGLMQQLLTGKVRVKI